MLQKTPSLTLRTFARASGSLLAVATLLFACGKQAEGERCDTRNGFEDCDTGLSCRAASELSLQGDTTGVGLCCPPDGVEPSVDVCRAGAAQPPEEDPPDGGFTEEDPAPEPADAG